jgi:protein-S-isoprenylcysteine O-methyltransferase Ste14
VILMLGAEASILGSWPLAGWAALFVLANAIYIPLHEEPAIEKRFGEDYRRYKANVPRWLPRLTPWRGPEART